MSYEKYYGLDYDVSSFAIANEFVKITNKACYSLGQQLQPFCIYGSKLQKENNVLDFSAFNGFVNENTKLVDEISEYRQSIYKNCGIITNEPDEIKKKYLFYDFLLSTSICYVEVPKYVTKNGVAQSTYDKYLCTKNPKIMSAWMGVSLPEIQAKYSARVAMNQLDYGSNSIRFVKLNSSSKGNSISVPRQSVNVETITCTPLYMIYAFIEGFKTVLNNNMVKFSYEKDNGTIRELVTTLNEGIIKKYYNDNLYVASMLGGVDINSVNQGGMMLGSKIHRGYIKVPELGASIYDTGVRSLNLVRLVKAEIVTEFDTSFINVDLNSVMVNFENSLDYMLQHNPNQVFDMYKELLGNDAKDTTSFTPVTCIEACKQYAQSRSIFLSTTYHRSLHLFLVKHPEWFPLYTGKPNNSIVSSKTSGVAMLDF